MGCDFRKEKDANYSRRACLSVCLHLNKTKIRQRGSRHLGIKRSQMRFDGSQLSQITQTESTVAGTDIRTHMNTFTVKALFKQC